MDKKRKVFGIYNADGTLAGELGYVVSKMTGKRACDLCDITHGWNPFGKRHWKRICRSSTLEIQLIHRDEATESQLEIAGDLPAFISDVQEGWVRIMTAKQIAGLKEQPSELVAQLEIAVEMQ